MINKLMDIHERKKLFILKLREKIASEREITDATISIILFGSFLDEKTWSRYRSDIDIFCYTRQKAGNYRVFSKILVLLKDLNKEFDLYPHPPSGEFARIIERIEEIEEYLFIVPLSFIGFHVIVFSKDDYNIKTKRMGSIILKIISRAFLSENLLLENVRSAHIVLSGEDVLANMKFKETTDVVKAFRLSKIILTAMALFLAIRPDYALGWSLKASTLALRNFEDVKGAVPDSNKLVTQHIALTNHLRHLFFRRPKTPYGTVLRYYVDSWKFLHNLKELAG